MWEHKTTFWDACRYADMFGPVIDFCWGIGAMMMYLIGIKVLGVEHISIGLLVAFGTLCSLSVTPSLPEQYVPL